VTTYIERNRLVCCHLSADQAFWDDHWRAALTLSSYDGFDRGHLGTFEGMFTRNLPSEGRIIEAGCGIGQYVLALRARGYDAEGVEWGAETVGKIRRIWPDLPVREGDVTALDVPDASYAGYISLGVMEHRREGPLPFLEEARRVLMPGAVAIVSVPFIHRLRALKRVLRLYPTRISGEFYQYIYPKADFRRQLEASGFTVVEQIAYDAVKGLCDESRLLRWWLTRTGWGRRLARRLTITGALDRYFGHMMAFVARKA